MPECQRTRSVWTTAPVSILTVICSQHRLGSGMMFTRPQVQDETERFKKMSGDRNVSDQYSCVDQVFVFYYFKNPK